MLHEFIERQRGWSKSTFGPGKRTKGITSHIRKELDEIEAAPEDVEEWIDVVILGLDGAWRTGASASEIIEKLIAKQQKNFAREYPYPVDEDTPSEHVRVIKCGHCGHRRATVINCFFQGRYPLASGYTLCDDCLEKLEETYGPPVSKDLL